MNTHPSPPGTITDIAWSKSLCMRSFYRFMLFLMLPLFLGALFSGCTGKSKSVTTITINPHRPEIVYIATNDKVFKTKSGGENWVEINQGIENTRTISLAVHPEQVSTVFAGTFGSAVFRSRTGGNPWFPLNAGMRGHVVIVNQFLFQPGNPEIMFAATTIGIFHSINGGEMWEEMPTKGMNALYTVSIVQDPKHLDTIYAGTSGGVYKTTTRGRRWVEVNKGLIKKAGKPGTALSLGVNTLVMDPTDSRILYAGTTKGIFKTTDGAETWIKKEKDIGTLFISVFVMKPGSPRELYAGTLKGLYYSNDGAETWSEKQTGLTNVNIRALAMHPNDSKILYAGTQRGLFKTTDGGETWEEINFFPAGQ